MLQNEHTILRKFGSDAEYIRTDTNCFICCKESIFSYRKLAFGLLDYVTHAFFDEQSLNRNTTATKVN